VKKTLAMLLLLVAIVGSFGFAQAGPTTECGDLDTPVDALCTDYNGEGTADDEACVIWINGVDPGADGCYNEGDAP
jgi:hypothetical protein